MVEDWAFQEAHIRREVRGTRALIDEHEVGKPYVGGNLVLSPSVKRSYFDGYGGIKTKYGCTASYGLPRTVSRYEVHGTEYCTYGAVQQIQPYGPW